MSGIPLAIEKSLLSASLNSTLLGVFLIGIYTTVYFGTVYIYLSRKLEHSFIVISTITTLFIFAIATLGLQWYLLQWVFVDNGDSRDDIFLTNFTEIGRTFWIAIAANICSCSTAVLADLLLIWRCFHICGRSFRVISLPLFFLLVETVVFLFVVTFPFKQIKTNLSVEDKTHINQITCAGLFASFCCTLTTTSLIIYRIYPIFKQDHSRGRFKKIFDILIQSAASYALTSLLQAILVAVETQPRAASPGGSVVPEMYIDTLFVITSALAPTLVVTRIALLSDKTEGSTTPHLSVLQFNQGQSTHHAISRMNNTNIPELGESRSIQGEAVKKETV